MYLWIFGAIVGIAAVISFSLSTKGELASTLNPKPQLVQSEQDFILGMVPHHQEAIDSSLAINQVATDPDIRALAQDIIGAQQQEVSQMKSWFTQWYGTPYQDNGKYKPMMRSSAGLATKEAEAQFVSDMIVHHEHAVLMAKELLTFGKKTELRAMANDVIRTQSQEIAQLKGWLVSKYGQTPQTVDHSMH